MSLDLIDRLYVDLFFGIHQYCVCFLIVGRQRGGDEGVHPLRGIGGKRHQAADENTDDEKEDVAH
jgi:hypothetical protein